MTSSLVTTETKVPTTIDPNAFLDIASEAATSLPILKFKKGKYVLGQDGEIVELGSKFVANMSRLCRGFVKFVDAELADKRLAGPGEPPIAREEVGDDDEDLWPRDPNGNRVDPWTPTWELPLKSLDTAEEVVFCTSANGGINAIGRLCNKYGARCLSGHFELPIVELNASSYRHRSFGEVDVPVLRVVDWQSETDLIAGEANGGSEDLSDDVPF